MPKKTGNFVSRVLFYTASIEEIDEYIEHWHVNPTELTLHEYLGLTREEYSLWIASPEQLEQILARRKQTFGSMG